MDNQSIDNKIVLFSLDASNYFAESIFEELTDQGVHITPLTVTREVYPNGEKHCKLDIPSAFSLLGKTAIYVGSLVSDDDILDVQRIGFTLAHSGIKRRIFVVPYLAYSTNDRAISPGEVVVSKITEQMMSSLGATDESNVFIFMDLHTAGLLHYFEGSTLRIELYGMRALVDAVESYDYDMSKVVIGAPNLRNSKWVNSYAQEFNCPIAFAINNPVIKTNNGDQQSENSGIVGDVKDKHVIIYTDILRDLDPILSACDKYLAAGATRIDLLVSHFAVVDTAGIQKLVDSPIARITATNSHPITQCELVQKTEKIKIINVAPYFARCLFEMLPSDRFPRLSV